MLCHCIQMALLSSVPWLSLQHTVGFIQLDHKRVTLRCAAMLTEREAILFLERFAQLQRNTVPDVPCASVWESELLDLIHSICATPNLTQVRLLCHVLAPYSYAASACMMTMWVCCVVHKALQMYWEIFHRACCMQKLLMLPMAVTEALLSVHLSNLAAPLSPCLTASLKGW